MIGENSNSSLSSSRRWNMFLAATPLAVLAVSAWALNPGVQLERGLAEAVATEARLIASVDQGRTVAQSVAGFEEGSEGFWLSRAPDAGDVSRVTWSAPLAPGDRLIVNFGAYDREVVEVISVAEAGTQSTRIDTGNDLSPSYVVVGRKLSDPDAAPIRLTVDAHGRGVTMLKGERDRSL